MNWRTFSKTTFLASLICAVMLVVAFSPSQARTPRLRNRVNPRRSTPFFKDGHQPGHCRTHF